MEKGTLVGLRKESPLVCIIIANWNGEKVLYDCLKSLKEKTDYPNYKIVVVDDSSTDGSVDVVRRNFPDVDLIENEKNLGYVKTNNIGMKYVLEKYDPEYVLLLNNDVLIIQPDWLSEMIRASLPEKVGVVGVKLLFPDGRVQHVGYSYEPSFYFGIDFKRKKRMSRDGVYEVDVITGACMLIKKEVIKRIKLLDETLAPHLSEDHDYCLRAIKNGFTVMYNGKSNLIHYGSFSLRRVQQADDDFPFFYSTRNNFTVVLRYFSKSIIPILALIYFYIKSIIAPKDTTRPISFTNVRIRKNPLGKIRLTTKAFCLAMKNKDIYRIGSYHFFKQDSNSSQNILPTTS